MNTRDLFGSKFFGVRFVNIETIRKRKISDNEWAAYALARDINKLSEDAALVSEAGGVEKFVSLWFEENTDVLEFNTSATLDQATGNLTLLATRKQHRAEAIIHFDKLTRLANENDLQKFLRHIALRIYDALFYQQTRS